MKDDPAYEVHDFVEAVASDYRMRREEELSALQAQFSDRGEQLVKAAGVRPDKQEIERARNEFEAVDEAAVVALWEKEGEAIFRASAELGLDPNTVAEEMASTLGLARPPSPSGAFLAFDVGEGS